MCASNSGIIPYIGSLLIPLVLLIFDPSRALADECIDQLPGDISSTAFFFKRDQRSIVERALNEAGLTGQATSPGFALLAGVSHYPHLPSNQQELKPAAEDISKLANYLRDQEHFDEIVVLTNSGMTAINLQYFLQDYFPCRLRERKSQKPRFLFAYSGHGLTLDGKNGFLLTSDATSLTERPRVNQAIDLRVVRVQFENVIEAGYQTLALINACFSGSFIRQQFGSEILPPLREGAFAITAGGADEPTWHDAALGTGSVFFEFLFKGLDGRIRSGDIEDGVVSVDELAAYLKNNIRLFSEDQQNPRAADLMIGTSPGGFFFLDRRRQFEKHVVPRWEPTSPFGEASESAVPRDLSGTSIEKENLVSTPGMNWPPKKVSDISYILDDCRPHSGGSVSFLWPTEEERLKYDVEPAREGASSLLKALRSGDKVVKEVLLGDRVKYCSVLIIEALQQKLEAAGMYSGEIDGVAGPATVSALKLVPSSKNKSLLTGGWD